MQLIPDWMNNIHPLIVHFPVALLVLAVITDLAGIIFKRSIWLKKSALGLYTVGSIGAVAAYLSGKQAADLVNFPTLSYPVISKHADLALYTMLFFVIYTIVRFFIVRKKWDQNTVTVVVLFLISTGGLFLLKETAEHGGELVFKYGVGTLVANVNTEHSTEKTTLYDVPITIAENGTWMYRAGKNSATHFRSNFNLLEGSWDDLILENKTTSNGTTILKISSKSNKKYIFTYGSKLKNLVISTKVNLDGIQGDFSLVHHISDNDTYDFVSKNNNTVKLGRLEEGATTIYDQGNSSKKGWMVIKAVSNSGHYRAYVDDNLIIHGHAKELSAGTAGFSFSGKGFILLSIVEVTSFDNIEMKHMEMNASEAKHKH